MKKILLAVLLVFVVSAGALAETTISGELQYGFTKVEDEDAVWNEYPGMKLKFAGDNWVVRFRSLGDVEYSTKTPCECGDPECFDTEVDNTAFGVKVDRMYLTLPLGDFGKVSGGRNLFATSDNGALDTDMTGLLYEGTFDKLGVSAMWARVGDLDDSEEYVYGGRASYAFDLGGETKLTVGGTYKKLHEDEDASYAGDLRVDLGESFDAYAEIGRDVNKDDDGYYDEDDDDVQFVCGEYRVAGFEFDGSYDFVAEQAEVSAEKSFNNVLFHLGYIMPEEDNTNKIDAYAKVTF